MTQIEITEAVFALQAESVRHERVVHMQVGFAVGSLAGILHGGNSLFLATLIILSTIAVAYKGYRFSKRKQRITRQLKEARDKLLAEAQTRSESRAILN